MNHGYNTRFISNINNKQGPVIHRDALAKLEHNILTNVNRMRYEVINMKATVSKRLLEKKKNLHQQCSDLEYKLVSTESSLNQLEQYGRQNNIVITGICDNVIGDQL